MGFFAMICNFFFLFFDLLLVGWFASAIYYASGSAIAGTAGACIAFALFGSLLGFIYIYFSIYQHISYWTRCH